MHLRADKYPLHRRAHEQDTENPTTSVSYCFVVDDDLRPP